ncbi:MAG TPA: hypothetical protein VG164_08100 [Trebonia sp.]|nr:hypothetical protein [Trebonia sp.]
MLGASDGIVSVAGIAIGVAGTTTARGRRAWHGLHLRIGRLFGTAIH